MNTCTLHSYLNPLNANPEKWSNTLKQIVGNLPTICLSVFNHFMNLALKGLKASVAVFDNILLNILNCGRILLRMSHGTSPLDPLACCCRFFKANLTVSFAVELMTDYFFLDLHACKKQYLTLSRKR